MENNLNTNDSLKNENTKKEYIKPTLKEHGGLSELVQLNPNRGADGEVMWVDCTAS